MRWVKYAKMYIHVYVYIQMWLYIHIYTHIVNHVCANMKKKRHKELSLRDSDFLGQGNTD